jgi:F1F0 ATPase subunit 2
MLESTQLTVAVIAGAVSSAIYFGGLWLTVKRLAHVRNPLVTYVASFVFRLVALGGGALLALQLGWQYLLAAMVGFLIVRYAITISLCLPRSRPVPVRPRSQP